MTRNAKHCTAAHRSSFNSTKKRRIQREDLQGESTQGHLSELAANLYRTDRGSVTRTLTW